ncbi:hypothetical protein [Calothrix sp. PCC 7507]|uniref:hypothetical protein n=1 Tax=Calothrix sp. PCC 7507 TaxID=99598 RepID=UPI00029EC7CB|nr:hypothetical protein [Calothrix sp. PCC 7507]AFY34115.1 hypothetical protein Cal7507_3724 [Calothrix sp. PCC 7507]
MSNYLSNLVARSINPVDVLQPRLPSLFEPIPGLSGVVSGQVGEQEQLTINAQPEEIEVRKSPRQKQAVDWEPSAEKPPLHLPHPTLSVPSPRADLIPATEYPSAQPPSFIGERFPPVVVRTEPQRQTAPEPRVIQQIINQQTINERIITPGEPLTPVSPKISNSNSEQPTAIAPQITPVSPDTETRKNLASPTTTVVIPGQVTPAIKSIVTASLPPTTTSQPAPVIQVTIGRIEIRATPPTKEPSTRSHPTAAVMGLDEYLRQRGGGK